MSDTEELTDRLHAARPDDDDAARTLALVRSRLFGPVIAPEVTLGRFTLIERIGRGGMGEVYAAHDPTLDRRVALKVVRDDARARLGDDLERIALLREARAAARLAHPNVVAVHEVGELADGAVYVAMEEIHGVTLRAWLRQPRGAAAILEVFVQAGRGLAAAHDAGLIHRDFKPENVLVSGEGPELRARVVDFGLARASAHEGRVAAGEAVIVGTPAYMSPEQLRGRPIDARSDLFAYCVALHEALTGAHPFGAELPGTTAEALAERIAAGAPIGARAIDRALRRVLHRGLAADPDARPRSMERLLDAIEATSRRRRRRALAVAVMGLILASSALTIASVAGLARSSCADAERDLVDVWDPPVRAAAAAAFAGAGRVHADEVWARIEPRLDDYARAFIASREQTCQGRLGAAALPDELAALRDACLDRRRAELRGLTELLARADPETIGAAITAVDELTPINACDDLESLRREASRGPIGEALRRHLLRLRSRVRAGHGREVAGEVEALAAAGALAAPLVVAESQVVRALLDEHAGDYDAAAAHLEEAVLTATAARDDRLHAEAATRLVWIHAVRRLDFTAARAWIPRAEAAITAAHEDPRIAAHLLDHRGALATLTQDPAAPELLQEALALRQRQALDDVEEAIAESNLGLALTARGESEAAVHHLEEAVTHARAAFGPHHPDVASMLANLGEARVATGASARGYQDLVDALAIKERALGPEHVALVQTLSSLGSAASALGRADEARAHYLRAVAIAERALGPESPRIEGVLHNLAFESWIAGDSRAVVDYAARALAIQRRVHGDDNPILAPTLELLARGHLGLGDRAAANAAIERALILGATITLPASVRGEILLSAAVIDAASGAPDERVRERARAAQALLGPSPSPQATAELDDLLAPAAPDHARDRRSSARSPRPTIAPSRW